MRANELAKWAWPICSTCNGEGDGCYNQFCEGGHTKPVENKCEECGEYYIEEECPLCEEILQQNKGIK